MMYEVKHINMYLGILSEKMTTFSKKDSLGFSHIPLICSLCKSRVYLWSCKTHAFIPILVLHCHLLYYLQNRGQYNGQKAPQHHSETKPPCHPRLLFKYIEHNPLPNKCWQNYKIKNKLIYQITSIPASLICS
jgi:hypothetical protein